MVGSMVDTRVVMTGLMLVVEKVEMMVSLTAATMDMMKVDLLDGLVV